ncbi:uncharacterized protein LOC113558304 [Rhopalosiphum maidis]|uniref:uncharacterized protein LOC113558304 n=1 Tax=Rhopalosiphum maidis TaxID=43146 RepID=UPI000EFE3564|nr:uncharacterized protein LOC113558304 [Rhopalosiphum maidis]
MGYDAYMEVSIFFYIDSDVVAALCFLNTQMMINNCYVMYRWRSTHHLLKLAVFFFFLSCPQESIDHIHVISLDPPVRLDEKPPDYASVVDVPPPSYDDAIKLDPQRLMDRGHRTATDTCSVTVVPADECDKTSAGNETADSAASQPTTKLAQAIRKSIRDIRKQLTNTVSDGAAAAAADVEQQQHQQSGSTVIHCDVVPTALRKSSDAPATV